jgi:hypothetical protein
MKKYEPELGQMCFGCPTSEFACPEFIEAGLKHLSDEIERVEGNIRQEQFDSPTHNNGSEYNTYAFQMRAYYWGEDEKKQCLPNFICDGLEVRWYKYLGRGMSMNKEIDANEFFKIIEKCLKAVREREVCELKKKGLWYGD